MEKEVKRCIICLSTRDLKAIRLADGNAYDICADDYEFLKKFIMASNLLKIIENYA